MLYCDYGVIVVMWNVFVQASAFGIVNKRFNHGFIKPWHIFLDEFLRLLISYFELEFHQVWMIFFLIKKASILSVYPIAQTYNE